MLAKPCLFRPLETTRSWLRQLLGKRGARRQSSDRTRPQSSSSAHSLRPMVRPLEPRFVLNATAELTSIGQLILTGDAAPDVLNFSEMPDNSILITDQSGAVIPIANHPGDSTDPLPSSAVTSGQVMIDLRGGDDILNLQLPSGLDVTLSDSDGEDQVNVAFSQIDDAGTSNLISLSAETIAIEPGQVDIDFTNDGVFLRGDILLGTSGGNTSVNLGSGQFDVEGSIEIEGDVSIFSVGGSVDWSDAVVSANQADVDVSFRLNHPTVATLELGSFGRTSGFALNDLQVTAASRLSTFGEIDLAGDFSAQGIVQTADIGEQIEATSIRLRSSGTLNAGGDLVTRDGVVFLQSHQVVNLDSTIDTSSAGLAGSIDLVSPRIHLLQSELTSEGGNVSLIGDSFVNGDVAIDSGNNALAPVAGDVRFFGFVSGQDGVADRLDIQAVGAVDNGFVEIQDAIGAATSGRFDVNSLAISAGLIDVRGIDVVGGNVQLTAADIRMSGDPWLVTASAGTGGDLLVDGSLSLPTGSASIEATGDIDILGPVAGAGNTDSLNLISGGSVSLASTVTRLDDLTIQAGQQAEIRGDIDLGGQLDVAATEGIEVFAASIETFGTVVFHSAVSFHFDVNLDGESLRFDAPVFVAANATATAATRIIDPVPTHQNAMLELVKTGEGTLVLAATNQYQAATLVQAGALEVRGSIAPGAARVEVANGATLAGDGAIEAETLVQAGGTFSPGRLMGASTASLVSGAIDFQSGGIYRVQLNGVLAGTQYDQLIVDAGPSSDETVNVEGAVLDLELNHSPTPATEFVIVRNDGSDAVEGRFVANFDASGNAVATPRVLAEGDLVRAPFGSQSESAFITYFGGDGNDIAIVTAGDVSIDADQVTLITRRGIDLLVRTGDNLLAAQSATPVIRPIAGLNNNELILMDTPEDDLVFIDVNGLADPSDNSIGFSGTFVFDGNAAFADNDRVVLFDSDPSTDDLPSLVDHAVEENRSGTSSFQIHDGQFDLRFTGLENVEQAIVSGQVEVTYSGAAQQIIVDADPAGNTSIEAGVGLTALTNLSLVNPSQSFAILSGAGNDQIVVNGFGDALSPLAASLTIDGQNGEDSLQFNESLTLGAVGVVGDPGGGSDGDLVLISERINLFGNVDTTGGSGDGRIELIGGDRIVVGGDASLFTGNGAILIDAKGGSVDTSDADLSSLSAGDAVVITDATTVMLGDIDTAVGRLVIGQDNDVTGAVTQAPLSSIKVDRLSVSTMNAVDLANLENEIGSIDQIQSRGGVVLVDSLDDLVVAGVDSGGADVRIDADGDISLQPQAVNAIGATVSLRTDGSIINLGDGANAQNVQAGVINLSAGATGIGSAANAIDVIASESINATTSVFGGDIYLANVGGRLPIGQIDAGAGDVILVADEVGDATEDTLADIDATNVTVTSINGIGTNSRIELQGVDTLAATTFSGGIDFDWNADSDTVIRQLAAAWGDISVVQSGNQRMEIVDVQNANDSIVIVNLDASIDVVGVGGADTAISAGGSGEILLSAQGDDSDIFVRNGISTVAGNINLSADRNAVFGLSGDISSVEGSLRLVADNRAGDRLGVISMFDGTVFDLGSGEIALTTDGDIGVASLVTTNQGDAAVLIRSDSGQITDRGDSHIDIEATTGTTTLLSRIGIGNSNPLDTNLFLLDSRVTGTGATGIEELDAVTLRDVVTADGLINVQAGGTITATSVVSQNSSGVDDGGQLGGMESRDIRLVSLGDRSDILVRSVQAEESADVILVAADDVLDTDLADEHRVITDDLLVLSRNAQSDQDLAIALSTAVNDLSLSVAGIGRGDIDIRELDSVNLASADAQADLQRVETSNGEIRISAGQSVAVSDVDLQNDSADRLSDVEIVAGGNNGRISLLAAESILLGEGVQISASQSSIDAVLIESSNLQLGEQIQISTGGDVGVARVFAPRPTDFDIDFQADTAFYDPTSVSTNILEQAAINDAEGRLTLDVGNAGERGLTINIDWGAETNRFQQIDNLSGDAPDLVVSHVYLEDDILNSRLNGRVSETAPLQVLFSVRHHESIRVIGDTITQGESVTAEVAGRLLSSTDNPLTTQGLLNPQGETIADLETGTASFVIPNLSIPVAFFPVRDVIPELSDPEVFVQKEQAITLSQSTFSTTESSVSASVSRPEYFQIRALSPDPDGEDLASPEQLPDDILDGNKLRDLFESLPDGRYEIEYVLGDGNERSILRVDLRGGRPIIESDVLEGGPLRLRELDIDDELDKSEDVEAEESEPDSTTDVGTQRSTSPVRLSRLQETSSHEESQNELNSDARAAIMIKAEAVAAGIGAAAVRKTRSQAPCRLGYFSAGKRFLRRSRNAG